MENRSPFHEALARAIDEGGRIISRTLNPPRIDPKATTYVTETVVLEFASEAEASRVLKLVREELKR